jgi:hypothetical protein
MPTSSKTVSTVAVKRPTLTEKYHQLSETLEAIENDRELLAESLSNAVAMLRQEDAGWALPGDGTGYRGFRLRELQKWSRDIRASLTGTEAAAPNPHMRNGLMLRHSFIWDGGIHYANVPGSKDVPGTRGKLNAQAVMDDLHNQRLVFGNSARRRREASLFSDGIYIVVGNNKTHKMRPIPIHEITDTMRDPLYEDEIIAYRWTRNEASFETDGKGRKRYTGARREKSYWVYVDWYEGEVPDAINYRTTEATSGPFAPSATETVLKDHTAFDLHANRPDGAAFGSPDAIAALVWARIIRDLIMNGVKMQDALAMFAFKVTGGSKAGQKNQALELAKPAGAGSAATMAGEQDMTPLNTAGKGYDFSTIGFVVATMAASLHVSGIALSANTALAGSSYGAAKTLDLPGRMAMESRRKEHIEFDERILRWLGAPEATAYFDNYDDATDEYRSVQAAMLAWNTGTLSPQGFRDELEIIYGRKLAGEMPAGAINPNTETKADKAAALAAGKDAPADAGDLTGKAAIRGGGKKTPKQAASPGQGRSSGAGSADHTGDLPQKS